MKRSLVALALLSAALSGHGSPFEARIALANGPLVTVASWDAPNSCVAQRHWTYSIEDLVKQTLSKEWFPSDAPDALRAGASIIRQDYWYFRNHPEGLSFCFGVSPYPYDIRDSRMRFVEGSGAVSTAMATDETVTKGWAPYGSGTANDMYLSFLNTLQIDTQTQALHNYPWTQIVASNSYPPGEYAPASPQSYHPGDIGVATPFGSACLYDCTLDYDGDGVVNFYDNCPFAPNPSQTNTDAGNAALNHAGADGLGDACDPDADGDGYTAAQEAPVGKSDLMYCQIMRADVDGDGVVSTLDLVRVASWYGRPVPPAPDRLRQDADYSISILDLVQMASVIIQPVSACP